MKYLKSFHVPLDIDESKLAEEELNDFREQMQEAGRRISELREKRGWTREEFAERAELNLNIVEEIERGEHPLSMHLAKHLGRILNVNWHTFQ